MNNNIAHATHPQRGADKGAKVNFMAANSSSDSLMDNSSVHMKSHASIKTFTALPPGATVIPMNFGVKFRPAKLGLEYKMDCVPDQLCIYEVTLTSYIEQGMGTSSIVDLIFELHSDFINPKIIARRQVTRLIDRLIARVGAELIANRKYEDKENAASNAAAATPAK